MELLELAGTQNERGDAGLGRSPGKGDPCRRVVYLGSDRRERVEHNPVLIGERRVTKRIRAAQSSLAAGSFLLALVLPGQKPRSLADSTR